MRKGFKGFMNKVFKVVWSKSKECYVVVPEIAKNNSGKKKVLASVLAGLALVGVGAQMGTPVDAYRSPDGSVNTQDSRINIAANAKPNNTVGVNSIVVGYENTTDDQNGTTALGANNTAKGNSALAVGNENKATNGAATAIGAGNEATGDTSVAIGNKSNASGDHSIAIGAYNNQNWTQGSNVTTPKPAGGYSLAVGNYNDALGSRATAVGAFNTAKGEWATAIGASTVASGNGDVAIGDTSKTNATGVGHAVAVGWHAETGAANAVAVGPSALASGKNSVSVGTNNNSRVQDTVTMGQDNDAKTMGGIAIGKNNMVDSTNGGTNHPETRDENSQIAIGRDNTATHLDTIAIGRDTHATGSGATVVGARADASGNNAIAIGNSGKNSRRVTASGVNSIAVGMQSQATGEATIAQGAAAEAAGNFGIAVGRISKAKANYSQAYGNEATSSTMGSIAMGALAKGGNDNGTASEGGSVAVGNAAWATGNRAIAIGSIRPTEGNLKYPTGVGRDVATGLQGTDYNTQATANQAIAVGSGARTEAQNSITMGTNAKVDATANGYTYQKTNNSGVKETLTLSTDPIPRSGINNRTTYDAGNGIAIGRDSHVTGKTTSAIAIGNSALADDGAVAATVIGAGASSKSVSSVAIGTTANVQGGEGAVAVGSGATVTGNYDNASAFGSGATVNKTNGTALGAGAQTNVRGGVAIGALSQADERSGAGESTGFHAANRTREYQGENKGLADNNLQLFHADIAGGDAGMVSVGSDGIKRQITNVASGTSDYDAVNVAQLRNVGVVVTGDTGKSDFLVHDGRLNVLGTGRVSTTAANDGAKDSKVTVAFDDTGMVKAGKNVTVDEKTVNGRTTYTINAADAAAKYDFLTNAKANGGKLDGTATATKVESGQTVNYAAGKNLTVKQDINQSAGEQTYTYSLNKDIDLTPDGSLKIGDTNITDNGLTINNGPSITKTGINAGGLNITNVKAGVNDNDAVNVSQLKKVRADERHIKPGEYAVDANGKVTMTYLDGNNKDVPNETAVITGIAKQDLSNINKGGETVIQNLAKKSIDMENGKNTTASHRDVNGVKTFKVDVEGDLTDITSITNKDGDGKVVFGGNQTVNVAGDHNINLNAKVGDITGLTNVTLDAPDFAKKGRAATEEQLKIVNNGFNNTVGLTGNTGATDLQKLNQAGGLSFGVIGANNGQYIKTTASGSNVAVDLSDDAKSKLNNTVEVRGKNAAKVTSVTENTVDGGKKTIYTVDVDNVTPTAASTEKVKAKANVTGSTDTNIAKVTPQTGDQYGDAGATYEVNVSRNDVKDAAREAVTVNTTNKTNNPITVTPVQDETNHNTTYTVTFDGNKAATQIPLTYKANGQNAQTVTLDKGLNFVNGKNTTASVDAEGVVKYDVNKDLVDIHSISNTTNGPKMEFGPNSINITNGPINMGDQNITNLKSGGDVINNAANIGDVKRISKANDLHIAPTTSDRTGETTATYAYNTADKSVTLKYNDGNGITQTGTIAKIDLSGLADQIKDGYSFSTDAKGNVVGNHAVTAVGNGKTVSYAAGDNLTVKQDIDNATGEHTYTYALSNNVDLTPNGSLKIGDTILNNGGLTITGGPSVTKTGINAGNLNITNVKAGVNDNDAVNVSQLKKVRADERHIKPGEYAVDANGKVTMTYLDGNNKDVPNETAVITGIAKQDLSNINKGGETVIQNLAKKSIDMENGKNTTASHRDVNGVKTFKVDVEGDLTDITSITNKDGDGKVVFGGNQTVNVAGDHNINLNAKVGDITGLTNVTLDAPDFAKKGRAATEEQLKIVNNGFNNTVGLTGNTGATDLQKLNQAGGLSFGVIGANNGQYIKTTASGSNVAVDLSDDAKSKLNNTVEVRGKNAAKVTSVTENTVDGGKKTIYTVDVDNVTPTAASTEKVKAKANVTGSTDTNIAKVTPQTGDQYGDAGATYEVNVSRNDVKDAAREAVTVNTTNKTNNPITVTPVQDETNHNTTYTVTFDGNKAATQIPLTYKANGQNAQTVTLDKGLNFVNGKNTTASVDAEGVVKYDVNKDLVDIHSISNTTNGPKMEFGPNSINITNGPINMGDQNITNLKSGGDVINNAANIGDVKRISKANDLHIAPTSSDRTGETTTSYAYDTASKSVTLKYNDGNGANQSGTVAKIDLSGLADQIKDGYSFSTDAKGNVVGNHAVTPVANGKTVSYAAGKNLTVAQNIDNATGEHTYTYALSNDVDLTPNGSLKIGDTILNNGGLTITGGPSVTKTGINAGNLNITNVKAGVNDTDAVNVKQLKDARTVVTSNDNSVTINKTENGNQVTYDLHVAPGAAQSVWNVKSTGNTTADSETAAKTISDGKTVEMAAGKNLTVKQTSNNDGAKVEFDLANDIKIGNDGKDGRDGVDGKIGVNGKDGSSVVINGKDGSIGLNGKDGKDGLTMKGEKGQPGLNGKDGITRIVYEDNNHDKHEVATLDDGLNFTGNNTDTVNKQKLNSLVKVQGEGVDKNTSATFKSAAGNINVKADGTDTLEVQLNKDLNNINTIKNGGNATFTIGGDNFAFNGGNVSLGGNNITNLKSGVVNNNDTDNTNAANIGDVKNISKANDIHVKDKTYTVNADKTVTLEYVDGNDNTINKTAKIDLSNLPTGDKAAVESVVKKSAAAGDTNIADITVADGKQTGDANAKYEVNVSRNAVKDAAREAVTVNTTNTTNNPITVTPVQDETNHNTTYQVTFDGEKAAKQIPLTYKANGSNNQTVTLDKGLNFTNGSNTTASVAADGVVKYDLNKNIDLTPNGSLKIGDTILNNGGLTITGGPSVTKTGINAGNLNITNVKAGVNDTDAVNVKQLKDARTVVTSNDNSVTVNKTENGNQVTYDLHVAPGAAQSVWNVKSTGNTTADSEATAKTISDGKTVEMAAGKNLTVKQTSNNDGAKVEFDLANDIKIGKDGKDGVDGKIGVNGKDGSSVVINGKDGSIGLNGKDGKDGLTMKGEKGADGVTRIVYEDHDNNKHEVATLDDGLRFDANSGGEKKNKLGSKVTVKGTGAKADSEYDSSNIKTSITQGADGNSEINIGLAKDLNNINTIKNGGPATFTIGGNEFKFDGGNVNMGGNNITNLKSGIVNNNSTDDTNGANIGDVKTISKANDLHIAPTTSNRTGETTTSYAYDTASKSVTLKYNDGNGANQAGTIAKIDLSGLADQIKDGYSFSTDAKGNVVGNHAVTAVGNGKTVSYAAGDNLTVKQDIDATTGEHTYTYALSNDIKVGKDGKDGIDGKIGVNGKDGSSVVINGKDGSIGLNGKDGKDGLTIRGEKGQDGVDGKNGTNGITRIVYEDHNNDKHEVATLDDGMKYAGDDAQGADKSKVIAKKLNETMDVVGGADKSKLTDNNIGVNNVDGKLKVQLSKEVNLTPSGSLTIGDTVVNNNGLTISGGPSIIKTGINAGNLNITNVKAGVNDTDAVNVKQLKDARTVVTSNDNSVTVNKTENGNQVTYDLHVAPGAAQSVWNVKSTGNTTADSEATAKTISDGKTVEMAAGKNLTVKQTSNNDGAKVEFDLANDIKIGNDGKDGKDGVDGKIGVNGKDGSSVVINGKDGSIGLNGKDGKDGLTMKGEKGQPGLNGKDGITRIVYEDNNHDKHEVATLDDGLNFTGNNTDTVNKQKLNSLVKVQGEGVDKNTSATFKSAAGNINVKADGTDTLEVQLNKDLKNINTIKNGGNATFTIGGDNFAFNGGNVSLGGNNITNLKSGIVNNNSTDDTNGANIGDVKTISKANDIHVKDTRYTVNADKTVTLEYVDGNDKKINKTAVIDLSNLPTGGNAITYKANNQNAQTVSLDKGLNFMDGNYTKASVDADGIVKYDVTIGKVKDGVDGKPGVDGNDGIATVKTVVDTINNSGWKGDVTGNTVGNHTATIVKPGTTVNFGAGKNVTVEQIVNAVTGDHTYNYALSDDIKLGKDGKDGVDGRIGVNGKDGSSVVINGKDGSIGLNGKDGKDGLTMKAENGQPGLNGKDGITRIVYEDKNNNKHEVATLDDGLRFTGNNEVENKQKLGSLVKIKGEGVSKDEEATFESAKGNIAVTADGTDTLTVRLNKNIKGIDSIQTKEIHLGTPDNYTTIKKDGDRIKYGDKTIANTDELWTIQANGTDVPANGGKVNVKGADGITVSRTANGEMTISGSGLGTMNSFNVKSTGNTAAGSETAAKKITDGKTVEFSGGNNVTVKQTSSDDGAKVEFALKNNIDLTQDGSVKIGDTKITNGGLVINNGPSITKDGINAGNKQITNVEDGVNDTDAVNVRQLKDAKTKLVDGQNTTVTGDGSKANPYKVNVEGDLNKITSITNKEGDGKLEFKGDQVVNVAGDNTIKLDGKTGDITGLTNKTLDSADFATKGRAATEEQLKLVQQEAAKKSTEKVQAKADANNIAKVAPKAGDTFGAAGATYEVSVDKNDVKDVAREAVTVSGDKKAITVDVQPNATNHTTNYQVNFNGKEAAKQIPLTYKENGSNARTVMLSDGLDFTNGVNTTAHTAANGKVSFDVKGDLTNITSISNNSNGPKMSFGGDSINITGGSLNMGDNYIHNVKAGEKNTDAVNVSQLKAAKTEVEAGRNVTVEHRLGENGQDIYKVNAEAGVDPRVDKLGEEIGHVGAQSAALSALKPIQYDPMEPTQIMAGYGNYRGNSALALGVAHYKNESTMFHAGVSWAGGNGHMMANAGVTWKVGNRDSEAAVADRYRKGPISSTYAMQTEVASMKAQNAGLKGEVSDLKAENEQIKAQNAGLQSEVDQLKAQMAAMMAKLGM